MSERIHIEGMGLLGSMLARRLDELGVPFTWSDNGSLFNAWGASTGLAAPDGDVLNELGRAEWLKRRGTPEAEVVPFVFAHKAPPHGAKYGIAEDFGLLRVASPRAVALNVPAFVEWTRIHFERQRVDGQLLCASAGAGVTVIECHPTPGTTDGAVWGWSARVKLTLPKFLVEKAYTRPALYARAHKFDITYAYPSPGTDTWLAGSAMVVQASPKIVADARLQQYVETWIGNAELLLGVSGVEVLETYQGWRPRARSGQSPRAERSARGWTMPALGANGMRRGWVVVEDLIIRAGWSLL